MSAASGVRSDGISHQFHTNEKGRLKKRPKSLFYLERETEPNELSILAVGVAPSEEGCTRRTASAAMIRRGCPQPPSHAPNLAISKRRKAARMGGLSAFGAGNQVRTGDLNLGKVALYQLSYSRRGPRF